tara:strand:- start:3353 stop:4750 length:1398 start_codon:yes stop_codon:yes gene_type:complete
MATTITQKPLYNQLPVGQEVIFTISNPNIVALYTNTTFQADVYISNGTPPTITGTPLATFKTKPNNAGVGIFDFRQVVESYVASDNLATTGSSYKSSITNIIPNHPIHLIDKYSKNTNAMRWLRIEFKTVYTVSGSVIIDTPISSVNYRLFNGYLKYDDVLDLQNINFGYDLSQFKLDSDTKSFLTNAPTTQFANLEDYGTVSFLDSSNDLSSIILKYYNSSGVQIGTENVSQNVINGGGFSATQDIQRNMFYFGCFPANLRSYGTTVGTPTLFQSLVTAGTIQGGHYTFQAFKTVSTNFVTQEYRINLNCPNLKGYESIRLCWLNQWGAWDYYTFTQKSTRNISTKGSTYEQLAGTWNDSSYRANGFKGGKKTFRVNATEKIKMNTDFVSENENVMFEELTNSPEVYILAKYSNVFDVTTVLNQYVTPVRITSTNFTKKTVANDKLIQYTFEVEKSKTLRTQSI